MANRYWVGGSDNWDGTAGTKWATTSGGSGGAAVPGLGDSVFLDNLSGSGTVTISAISNCLDLNLSGFAGTITGSSTLNIYGSLDLGTTATITLTNNLNFKATSAKTITCHGKLLSAANVTFNGAGGTWTQQDAFTVNVLTVIMGTLDTNSQALAFFSLVSNGAATRSILLRNSVITITRTSSGLCFDLSTTTGLTFTPGTSKIVFTASSALAYSMNFGGLNIYDLTVQGSAAYTLTLIGAPALNTLTIDASTTTKNIRLVHGTTLTVASLATTTSAGKLANLASDLGGSSFTLAKSGAGRVFLDYLSLQDVAASPADTWFAGAHSVNTSGNSGWTFATITSAPQVATVALSGSTPYDIFTGSRTSSPTTAALTLSGGSSAPSPSGTFASSPARASIALSGEAVASAMSGTFTSSPPAASLALSGSSPAPAFSGSFSAAPQTADLTLSPKTSVRVISGTFTSSPARASISLSGRATAHVFGRLLSDISRPAIRIIEHKRGIKLC